MRCVAPGAPSAHHLGWYKIIEKGVFNLSSKTTIRVPDRIKHRIDRLKEMGLSVNVTRICVESIEAKLDDIESKLNERCSCPECGQLLPIEEEA